VSSVPLGTEKSLVVPPDSVNVFGPTASWRIERHTLTLFVKTSAASVSVGTLVTVGPASNCVKDKNVASGRSRPVGDQLSRLASRYWLDGAPNPVYVPAVH